MLDKDYTGTPETVFEILRVAYGPHGAQSWKVRKFAEDVVKRVRSRDYWSEALALYYKTCGPAFRYTHDPQKVELVKSPEKMITEIEQRGVTLGDCDDLTSVLLALESVVGVPCRVGTGAFELNKSLWPAMAGERPEKFGFKVRGPGFAGGPFTHVWPEARMPTGQWVLIDPVAGPESKQMRRRLRQVRYFGVD
jgi:transglutaminase-like putative cysteine protease